MSVHLASAKKLPKEENEVSKIAHVGKNAYFCTLIDEKGNKTSNINGIFKFTTVIVRQQIDS